MATARKRTEFGLQARWRSLYETEDPQFSLSPCDRTFTTMTLLADECLKWREKEFQKHVLALAAEHGWTHRYHTYFSDRSETGFPDLYMIRPSTGQALVAELKTMKGRLSPAQETWFEAFRAHQSASALGGDPAAPPIFGVYIWRPCCWNSGEIAATLQ